MGSENLSHKFTIKDPTFKGESHKADHSSHQSSAHTSGTHPVSVSNGPTSSSSSAKKHQLKSNSKYGKLYTLHREQLAHIGTTLDAIESLSTPANAKQTQLLSSAREELDRLNEKLESLRDAPSADDYLQFDWVKRDIDALIDKLKAYKTDSNDCASANTLDCLVGAPLDVPEDDKKTLIYF